MVEVVVVTVLAVGVVPVMPVSGRPEAVEVAAMPQLRVLMQT
jgi:hypothetical protein